jgi:hypothetical protein
MSASAKTSAGLLPPSSSETRFTGSAQRRMISEPVAVDPVNATLSTPSWRTRCAPVVGPSPGTTLTTPGGMPTSAASSAIRSAVSGVAASGFRTTVQPAASAGASFHEASMIG